MAEDKKIIEHDIGLGVMMVVIVALWFIYETVKVVVQGGCP